MLRFTGDASGDVCAHARSCFIQLVSKVTLQVSARRGGSPVCFSPPPSPDPLPTSLFNYSQTFMDTFNDIARLAHSNDDQFYAQVREAPPPQSSLSSSLTRMPAMRTTVQKYNSTATNIHSVSFNPTCRYDAATHAARHQDPQPGGDSLPVR